MRLHSYRDESHSRHFDLIFGGDHPWSIDLVSVIASGILVVGFACALMAHWVPLGFSRCCVIRAGRLRSECAGPAPPLSYLSMEGALRRKGRSPPLHRPLSLSGRSERTARRMTGRG